MNTRKQKRKQTGGQPLSYTNPGYAEPAALAGAPILQSTPTLARPEIQQRGGTQMVYTDTGKWIPWTEAGAPLIIVQPQIQPQKGGQPLSYTNPNYTEPAALAGAPILYSAGTIARPEIAQKGGFSPSIMSNLVSNGAYLAPLAVSAAYRLINNGATRKQRGGSGKGKPGRPRFATRLNEWEYDLNEAKKELAKYGEPTAAEYTHLAALRTGRKGKPENANAYVEEFKQRFKQRRERRNEKKKDVEEKKIQRQIAKAERELRPERAAGAGEPEAPVVAEPEINRRDWKIIQKEAKQELQALQKKMKPGNINKFASMKRVRDQARINAFLQEVRARPDAKPKAVEESKYESSNEEEIKAAMRVPAKKAGREEWEQYQTGAQRMLDRIGPATIAEVSSLAKMMKNGENIRPFLDAFEQRVKATGVRVARLEREREERKEADESKEESKEEDEEPVPARAIQVKPKRPVQWANQHGMPLVRPVGDAPGSPAPAAVAMPLAAGPAKPVAMPLMPGDPDKFARLQARIAELSKKYPEGK